MVAWSSAGRLLRYTSVGQSQHQLHNCHDNRLGLYVHNVECAMTMDYVIQINLVLPSPLLGLATKVLLIIYSA